MLYDRIAASPLFAKQDHRVHKARFAEPHELEHLLGQIDPIEASLLLGVGPYGRFLRLRSTSRQKELGNLMVVAPTRKGKGLLAVSQLLTWPNSIVLNDIKGELFELTAGYRATLGPVFVLDPRGVGHQYDPLAACQDEDDCRAMAVHLLRKSLHDEPDPFIKRAIERARKRLRKRAQRRFRGYPVATVALYGPDHSTATKLTVGIVPAENAGVTDLRRWLSEGADIRNDAGVAEEVLAFIDAAGAKSVVMTDRIIGCPHEEGIDYEGSTCPACPFWAGRDRWTGEYLH